MQLSDVRQAQFAGYYVAQSRGYYRAEGLEVTIRPGRAGGDSDLPMAGADVWSAWMTPALEAAAHGLTLVNIAQIFMQSGLVLICRRATGIRSPGDFAGHVLGVWPGEARVGMEAWLAKLDDADVTVVPVARREGLAPLASGRVACETGLGYDEAVSDVQVFHLGDVGMAPLQDGLYVTEASLADPARVALYARFLRASLRGWSYAIAHRDEAVRAVLGDVPASAGETRRQMRMMDSVAHLVRASLVRLGYLPPRGFDHTVGLLRAGATPVLAAWPAGGWTHAVWDRAMKEGKAAPR